MHRPCARVKSIGSRCRRNRFPPWSIGGQQRFSVSISLVAARLTTGTREKETRSVLSSQPVHLESFAAVPPLPATRNLERAAIDVSQTALNHVSRRYSWRTMRTGYSPRKRFDLRSRPICDSVILCNSATESDAIL